MRLLGLVILPSVVLVGCGSGPRGMTGPDASATDPGARATGATAPSLAATGRQSGAAGTPSGAGTDVGAAGPGTGPGTADGSSAGTPARTCPPAADLPLRQRLQQTLMIWVDGGADALPGVVTNPEVLLGGIFVGGGDAGLAAGMLRPLADRAVPPLVAVDEEGGRVQRIDNLVGDLPSAREQAATMTVAQVQAAARERGRQLARLGVTIDFAPVVDLDGGDADRVIGDRSYSADPDRATAYAGAFARGLQQAGVIPTLKHFPGHGRADGDSHRELPRTPPLAALERRDLLPYAALLRTLPPPVAVMVGHLDVPGLTTDGRPASLDPATYTYLRQMLGFTGPVVTDELSGMRAVADRYGTAEATIAALAAGADLVLLAAPGDLTALLDRMAAAVDDGTLPVDRVTEAADRVLAVKACPTR